MTINIKKDRIEFVSNEGTTYSLRETGDGFSFDGVIEGTNIFQNGFQGIVAGFTAGGDASPFSNVIDKFPFATDGNATDVGDLTQARGSPAGQSSSISGYVSGGMTAPTTFHNTIDKFSFTNNSNATDVGDLTQIRNGPTGQSSSISGYSSAGTNPSPTSTLYNTIDKFLFATDSNAGDVGDLTVARSNPGSQSSPTSGYTSGGTSVNPPFTPTNTIDKFPFATDTNASDVGDLTESRAGMSGGQSSSTNGYNSGGIIQPTGATNTIDKFPFAADTNASDVGDLTQTRRGVTGQSSTTFGYISGGFAPPFSNVIDKFPFSANSNATDVGDLTQGRYTPTGQQN
jgi:hypothetical protein